MNSNMVGYCVAFGLVAYALSHLVVSLLVQGGML
jgi:hypothetical protein